MLKVNEYFDGKGETFIVEKDKKFKVKAQEQTAYLCIYK
jgi:uncharacterized protein YaiE (UPF0345 family)